MAISLLAYVAAFAVKLYYWGNYFFTLLQINYFHTSYFFGAAISSELLLFLRSVLFQNSYLFATVIFSEQLLFQGKHSTEQTLLENRQFFRAGALRNTDLFDRDLFRLKTFLEEILFRTRYFCTNFQKSYFLEKANSSEKQYPALPTFSGSRIAYFFYIFRRATFSQLRFLYTATFPIYQLVIKSTRWLGTVKVGSSFLGIYYCSQSHVINKVYLIIWLHKVLWNCYFLMMLLFQSIYFLRSPNFSKQLYTLSQELLFQQMLFFRTANLQQLTSFSQLHFPFIIQQLALLVLDFLNLTACVRYFLLNFYFSPNDSPLKTMKNVFYFI